MERRKFLQRLPIMAGAAVAAVAGTRMISEGPPPQSIVPTEKVIKYGNQTVKLMGIYHNSETLDKYTPIIEQTIKNSNLVLLEGIPFTKGTNGTLLEGRGEPFFDTLAEIAKNNRKYIGTLDPSRNVPPTLYLNLLFGVPLGINLGFLTGSILNQERKISRRGMLTMASISATVTGTDLLLNYQTSPLFMLFDYLLRGKKAMDKSEEEFSGIRKEVADIINFRNATVSLRLIEILDSAQENTNLSISLIYGANHINAIEYYLQNSEEARALLQRPESSIHKIFNQDPNAFYKSTPSGWENVSINSILQTPQL